MAFLEAELHLLRDQLGSFELRMRAIERGNEKAASSTSAIAQSIINNIDDDKIKHNNPHSINNINNNETKHNTSIQQFNMFPKQKGLAGVWLWNSEMQASEYYYLRKKSSTSSSKGPISRYSGWVTDGSPGTSSTNKRTDA
ncbi:hypothetical protein PPACK8108_LOCUS12616 [Phakopsora pachyrhizi]|uniref:Uncharacterized protein n=1 Tax=Phakopsora pachyrhizi TaxID=170000 RepID=A0AAV0B291_PHAPC|nr:hypothetical protein PPACK8108_LOCUS12616 [Phakopsora pachyrhizi]